MKRVELLRADKCVQHVATVQPWKIPFQIGEASSFSSKRLEKFNSDRDRALFSSQPQTLSHSHPGRDRPPVPCNHECSSSSADLGFKGSRTASRRDSEAWHAMTS